MCTTKQCPQVTLPFEHFHGWYYHYFPGQYVPLLLFDIREFGKGV